MLKLNYIVIHMLKKQKKDLNTSHVKVKLSMTLKDHTPNTNLNTSHVKVKLVMLKLADIILANLNTSHVKVKPTIHRQLNRLKVYLNTSHVKVKRKGLDKENDRRDKFKYISC